MSFSPFDHPVLSGLLGDDETARHFSAAAEIEAMLAFERALADAAAAIVAALETFKPDMAGLKAGVGQDGVVVPELVRQIRAAVDAPHDKAVHFGATSQDVIDTGLILRLKPAIAHLDTTLGEVIARLAGLEASFGSRLLMGRTRMQAAIPITVADRVR